MLNIAKTIYAGWNTGNKKYELSEAEIIPLGDSQNEKKKLDALAKKYPTVCEHENIPLPGFTLYKSDKKSWGSTETSWLVIDPRGFLVRISSQNLENILHVTGITEGLIQEKCVWARENSETAMCLIPVSSANFTEVIENTELIESKVDINDVQIGDTVFLQNKMTGKYMGVASLYGITTNHPSELDYKSRLHLRKQIIETEPGIYYFQTDLKILKILNKTTSVITREESVATMNKWIENSTSHFSNNPFMPPSAAYDVKIRLASVHAVSKINITFEEITKAEAEHIFVSSSQRDDSGMLMLEDAKKDKFIIDLPYRFNGFIPATRDKFKTVQILEPDTAKCHKFVLTEKRKSIWNNKPGVSSTASLDNFTKFYKIVKHVKGATYI